MSYHVTIISRGKYGETSKIREELEELEDAERQGVRLMQLVELSDLLGAVVGYLERHHPGTSLADLLDMTAVTRRVFESVHRVAITHADFQEMSRTAKEAREDAAERRLRDPVLLR